MDPKPCRKGSRRMPFIEFVNRRRYFERGTNRIHMSLQHAGIGLPSAQRSIAGNVGDYSVIFANRSKKRLEIILHQIVQCLERKLFRDGRKTLDVGGDTDREMG